MGTWPGRRWAGTGRASAVLELEPFCFLEPAASELQADPWGASAWWGREGWDGVEGGPLKETQVGERCTQGSWLGLGTARAGRLRPTQPGDC